MISPQVPTYTLDRTKKCKCVSYRIASVRESRLRVYYKYMHGLHYNNISKRFYKQRDHRVIITRIYNECTQTGTAAAGTGLINEFAFPVFVRPRGERRQ